jgi:hypothetical protein
MLNLQIKALKPNYFAYIHSITQYGIFFGGDGDSNSSKSGNIFTVQKKIFRIVVGARLITQCISLFKKLEIFTSSVKMYEFIN